MVRAMWSSMWALNRIRPYTDGPPEVKNTSAARPTSQATLRIHGQLSPRRRRRCAARR